MAPRLLMREAKYSEKRNKLSAMAAQRQNRAAYRPHARTWHADIAYMAISARRLICSLGGMARHHHAAHSKSYRARCEETASSAVAW